MVTVYDHEVEARRRRWREVCDFKQRKFARICEEAADELSDYRSAPPDNFAEELRSTIIENAKNYDDYEEYDIDVEVDPDEVDGEPLVRVYLTRYADYTIDDLSEPCNIWLTNYFNTTGEPVPEATYDDYDVTDDMIEEFNDLPMTDQSLLDFFFRHNSDE